MNTFLGIVAIIVIAAAIVGIAILLKRASVNGTEATPLGGNYRGGGSYTPNSVAGTHSGNPNAGDAGNATTGIGPHIGGDFHG